MVRHTSPPAHGEDEYQRLLSLLDQRRFDEAHSQAELLIARPEVHRTVRARAHNLLCWLSVEGLKAPGPEALYHGEEAVRLARALSEGELLARSLINLAAARFQAGQYTLARATYQEVQELLAGKPRLLPGRAVLVLHGTLPAETARRTALALLALARELGDEPVAAEALCLLAQLDQAEGRKEAAWRARTALLAALGTGRRDVADLVRSRLAPLLDRGL